MLQLILNLQEAITFLRNKRLPVVRRYEPWHGILLSCATSLEETVLTCGHATNQEFQRPCVPREQLDKMTDLTGFLYLEYERQAELFEAE